MKVRRSPSSRRSSSRRNFSSVRAMSRSESKTRSMNSTWKIAFESACAGPSWISWASRTRSPSWASTIRIWSSVGSLGRPTSVTSDASPRSRNSQVVSRLRMASSSRESSASWRPRAPLDSAASARVCAELGVRGARLGGHAAPSEDASKAGSAPPLRARRLVRAPRGPGRGPPSGPSRRCRPGDSGRGFPGACSPRSPRRRRPGRGARRSGSPPALPGVHPSRGVYRPSPSRREPRRRRGACRRHRDARRDRHARARDPEHADALDGLGIRRVGGDRQQDLVEARGVGVRPVEDGGPRRVGLATISHLAPKWVARSRTSEGASSGSARVGTRSVSASQIGKSWMTGRAAVERSADRRHLRGQHPIASGRGVARCPEAGQERDREQHRARRSPSSGPSHATGRVQPGRRPSAAMPASSAPSAARSAAARPGRRRGGRCPTSSPPGTEARGEEGQHGHEQDGRRARSRPCQGRATRPRRDIGTPRSSRTFTGCG